MTSPIRYPKLKMAQRYQVGDTYRPIQEVTAIPNVRRNVGIITEVLEDEHSIVIEADYGYKKGDSANIFIDTILKHKNMETNNPIQFIDFDISPRCGKKIDTDVAVIYSRNSSSNTYYLRLPSKLNDVLNEQEYKYIRVAVNNLTNEVFFVLDKETGMPLRNKTGLWMVNCKSFVEWLEARFGLNKNGGGQLVLSDNLSRKDGYTFRVEAKE